MTNTHMMVDIETLGTGYDAAIVQIGAVLFDPFGVGHVGSRRWNVLLDSAMEYGAVDASTLLWWFEQEESARKSVFFANRASLGFVLDALSSFWRRSGAVGLWANGATFDPVILATAYRKTGVHLPWGHREVRDMRTLMWMAPEAARWGYYRWDEENPDAIRHDALHDALRQASVVQDCLRAIGLTPEATADYTSTA